MKKIKFSFILLLIISISTITYGQSKKKKRWDEAITALQQTEFITKYKKQKEGIEELVSKFHLQKDQFNNEEVKTLSKSYEETVEEFNSILNKVKRDFTDRQSREYLSSKPDDYASNFSGLLANATRRFDNNCAQIMEGMMEEEIYSNPIIVIPIIIGLVRDIAKLVGDIDKKMKNMSAEYIEDNMLSELRLKKWDQY